MIKREKQRDTERNGPKKCLYILEEGEEQELRRIGRGKDRETDVKGRRKGKFD